MADKLIGDYPVPNFTVHKGGATVQQVIARQIREKVEELNVLVKEARGHQMTVEGRSQNGVVGCTMMQFL